MKEFIFFSFSYFVFAGFLLQIVGFVGCLSELLLSFKLQMQISHNS